LNGPGQSDSARELLQPVFDQFVEEAVPGGHFPEPRLPRFSNDEARLAPANPS
jgi:hypothetical protein